MIIENVKLLWARLGSNAGTKFKSEEKQWSVDIVLNEEQAKKWEASGVNPGVKFKDGEHIIKVKKDCAWKKSGDQKTPPMVVNEFGEPLDPLIIGNGSVGNVQMSIRDWEFMGEKGKTAELVAVQVLDLQEYTGGNGDQEMAFSFNEKSGVALSDEDMPF